MDNTKQMLANANGKQFSVLYQSAVSKLAATTAEAQGIVLLPNGINPRSKVQISTYTSESICMLNIVSDRLVVTGKS